MNARGREIDTERVGESRERDMDRVRGRKRNGELSIMVVQAGKAWEGSLHVFQLNVVTFLI